MSLSTFSLTRGSHKIKYENIGIYDLRITRPAANKIWEWENTDGGKLKEIELFGFNLLTSIKNNALLFPPWPIVA